MRVTASRQLLMPSLLLALASTTLLAAQADDLRTRAERTDYMETSRYADVTAFLERVAERSPAIHLTSFGYTNEGRALPLAVVGDVADASPEAVRASGKLRVYLQGNIHGGEVCGKEALLMLLREIAAGDHPDWTDKLVLLVAPIYNADGNERVDLGNRPAQNGPVGGMGQRPNAQGLDLNRDHMKLDSPEARSLVFLMGAYAPHVAVDLHTTNGTRHAYHLTYAPPLNPDTHPAILELLRGDWLPSVTATMRSDHDELVYYYGNLPFRGGAERSWATFDHRPRFNNNYVGLRNRVAILSEAYAYATFRERVEATLHFVQAILDYAATRDGAVREAIARADADPVPGRELAVRSTLSRSAEPVEILMGEVATERHPYTGRPMLRRLDVVKPERMVERGTFEATATETAPLAYLVPADLAAVLDRLRAHGVLMEPLAAPLQGELERFRIDSSSVAEREFQGHRERTLEGAWEPFAGTVPAGTWRVEMAQPLARLAFYLLEPRSDDGLTNWNFFDEALEGAAYHPVLRVPATAAGGPARS